MRNAIQIGGAILACLIFPIAPAFAQAPPVFAVTAKYPVPGEGGWDYLTYDNATHRLFISRGTHVTAMDTENGKVVGEIKNTLGVHGIALIPKLGKGYTSNGRDNTVTVFDYTNYAEKKRITVGTNPDAIIYDSKSKRILTMNGRSEDISVIDPETDTVVGTIKVSGKPEFAAGDGEGFVYVNIEDKSVIEKIDVAGLKSVASYPLAPGEEPSGLAIDRKGHRIFSVCGNNLMTILDTTTGKLAGTAKIGNGPDAAAYDATLDLAFSSNGADGTLTVVNVAGGKFEPIQTLTTQRSARTMILDRRGHRIFLIAAEFEAPAPGERRGKMKPDSAVILVVAPKS